MKVVKTYTKTFEVENVSKYRNFGEFKEARIRALGKGSMRKFNHCLKCDRKFQDEDTVFMAFTNKGNFFFCEKCAEEFGKGVMK